MRFERKYFVENLAESLNVKRYLLTESILKFHTAFPNRNINSIYFDDIQNTSFYENIDGLFHKIKLRVRWYNQDPSKCYLEIKTKEGDRGNKLIHPFQTSYTAQRTVMEELSKNRELLSLFPQLKDCTDSTFLRLITEKNKAVSFNSYNRAYLKSNICNARLTIDTKLFFLNLRKNFKEEIINEIFELYEIKYESENEKEVRLTELFLAEMPARLTKVSKFIQSHPDSFLLS